MAASRGFFSSVWAATGRVLVNVNVSHGGFYNPIQLDQLIWDYKSVHGDDLVKLNSFLENVQVEVAHLSERNNKVGHPTLRIKTVFGLATTSDGREKEGNETKDHYLRHPPRIRSFGAGPDDVQFFLENPSALTSTAPTDPNGKMGGSSGGMSAPDLSNGRYVSVKTYYIESKYIAENYAAMIVIV